MMMVAVDLEPIGMDGDQHIGCHYQKFQAHSHNAVISRAVLQIENCDALAASRLMTLLCKFCLRIN